MLCVSGALCPLDAHANPATNYSIRFGGSDGDFSTAVTADQYGTYITGYTYSTNFPAAPPRLFANTNDADMFVTKLNATGDIVWSVVIGGSNFDAAQDITSDSEGNVYVAGRTASANFPTLNAFQATAPSTNVNAFVLKLDPAGSLIYSTYLGDTHAFAAAITVATNTHEAIVVGTTGYIGTNDVFVARLGSFGTNLTLSTFLGGSNFESPLGVAVDTLNHIYVAGSTGSPDFPVTTNAYGSELAGSGGIFVTKLDGTNGTLIYSALLGMSDFSPRAMAVDAAGAVYIAGADQTLIQGVGRSIIPGAPPPPPTVTWSSNAAFLVRLAPSGSQLDYMRKYDTSDRDSIEALRVDSAGVLHLAGNLGESLFSAEIANPANAPATGFTSFVPFNVCDAASSHLFAFDPTRNLHVVARFPFGSPRPPGVPPPALVYGGWPAADVLVSSYSIPPLSLEHKPVVGLSLLNLYEDRLSSNEVIYARVDGGDLRGELATISVLSGTNIIATFDGAPRVLALTNLAPGAYHLTATAVNAAGVRGTSCPLSFTVLPAPRNDSFYRSMHIEGTSYVTNATNEGASAEPTEPGTSSRFYATPRRSVWWCWTAPISGPFAIEITSNEISPQVGIYFGPNLSQLERIASAEGAQNVMSAFKATAGTHYFFSVDSSYSGDFLFRLRPAAPPSNDDHTNRIALTGVDFTIDGSNVDATREPTLNIDSTDSSASVWWRWTAPATGRFLASVASQTFSPLLAIRDVTNPSGGIPGYDQPRVSFSATVGEQFDFRVAAYSGAMGHFTLSVSNLTLIAPPNDSFSAAVLMTGFPATESGTTLGATTEPYEPGSTVASVWYRWTASSSLIAVVEIAASSGVELRVYSGTALSNLVLVGGDVASSIVAFPAEAGRDYYFSVDDYYGNPGNFTLTLRAAHTPTNDNFASAVVLNGLPVNVAGSNREASLEPGEPSHFEESVWYRWVAPSNGHYVLSIEGSYPYSYRSSLVTPYTGTALSNLVRATPATPAPEGYFTTRFFGSAGTEYYLAVSGYAGSGDLFRLRIRPALPPANDNFADRVTLFSGVTFETNGSTVDASVESGEPLGDSLADKTVWWSWTAPESRKMVIVLGNVTATFQVRVFSGTTLSSLSFVGGGYGSSSLDAQAGQTYAIQVESRSHGTFMLNIAPVLQPPNDHFTNAFTLSGISASATGIGLGATLEPGEHAHAYNDDGSLWWNWTAPANGLVRLSSQEAVIVYIGDSVNSLTNVTGPSWRYSNVSFVARAGVTYRIAVYSRSVQPFDLFLAAPAPPPSPELASIRRLANGSFEFQFDTIMGQTNVIDTSTDLINWVPIATNFLDCGVLNVLDPAAAGFPHRFYRLRRP